MAPTLPYCTGKKLLGCIIQYQHNITLSIATLRSPSITRILALQLMERANLDPLEGGRWMDGCNTVGSAYHALALGGGDVQGMRYVLYGTLFPGAMYTPYLKWKTNIHFFTS